MKRLFVFITALLIGAVAFSQHPKVFLPASNIQKESIFSTMAQEGETHSSVQRTSPSSSSTPNYYTNNVNATKIGESSNSYSYLLNPQAQISTVSSVGTNGGSMAFVFRENAAACGSSSGNIRYNLSTDGGQTWFASSAGCYGSGPLNPALTYPARFPNAYLFSDGSNSSPAALNIAACAATLSSTSWAGCVFSTNNDLTSPIPTTNNEDYFPNLSQTGLVYRPTNITQRIAGEFWSAVVRTDTIDIYKGLWNAANHAIAWNLHQQILMANSINPNGYLSGGLITFSPDGTMGYLVGTGDLVGGFDNCANLVVAEFNLATGDFDVPYEFSVNHFPAIPDWISHWVDAAGNPISTQGSVINFSATVDARNFLHVHCLVAPSGGAAGNLYSSFGTDLYDFTKDPCGNWALLHVSPISKAKAEIGSGTNLLTYFSFADISRSPDGNHIIFSWSDTDTTGIGNSASLDAPNLKGRIYYVQNDMISPIVDWTSSDPTWSGTARMPKTAEVALEPSTGTFIVPTTVIRFFGTPNITDPDAAIKTTDFYYFSNIQYTASQANTAPTWVLDCSNLNVTSNIVATPTSNCNSTTADGTITFNNTQGCAAPYLFTLINTLTNDTLSNSSGSFTGLVAGPYQAWVTTNFGCSSQLASVSVAQPNAPTVTLNATNPNCNGASTGAINTIVAGGNCAAYTYSWSNGATTQNLANVGAGVYNVGVECGGCFNFGTITLTDPMGMSFIAAGTNPTCSNNANGEATVFVYAGAGPYTYSWSNGATADTLLNLGGGTYTVTVTDVNGCTASPAPITLVAPAAIAISLTTANNNLTANVSGGTGGYFYSWVGPACFTPPGSWVSSISTVNCSGQYCVFVTDYNTCVESACLNVVSVEKEIGISTFELYPNPASTITRLEVAFKDMENGSFSLLNANAQTLIKKEFAKVSSIREELNIASLPAGVYLVKITTSLGTVTRRLMIE